MQTEFLLKTPCHGERFVHRSSLANQDAPVGRVPLADRLRAPRTAVVWGAWVGFHRVPISVQAE